MEVFFFIFAKAAKNLNVWDNSYRVVIVKSVTNV